MNLPRLAQRMEALERPPARTRAVARPAAGGAGATALPAASRFLLRPEEAATLLGVSAKTLKGWPVRQFSYRGVRGYRPRDLERFLEGHMVSSVKTPQHWEPV